MHSLVVRDYLNEKEKERKQKGRGGEGKEGEGRDRKRRKPVSNIFIANLLEDFNLNRDLTTQALRSQRPASFTSGRGVSES